MELPLLNNFVVTRKIVRNDTERMELHGFCDASEKAYGACLYLRTTNNLNESSVHLVCAKSQYEQVVFWSDSTIVLNWVRTPHLLKTFVANRVAEIQLNTSSVLWNHVSTFDKTADLISRGQLPLQCVNNQQWLHGPTWLAQGKEFWKTLLVPDIEIPEQRSRVALVTNKSYNIFYQFSSITTLNRVIAYILRFKNN